MTRSMADILTGASISAQELTVITRNVRDFLDCDVPVFDPFVE